MNDRNEYAGSTSDENVLPQRRQAMVDWLNSNAREILGAFSYSNSVNGSAANRIFFTSEMILFENPGSGRQMEARWADIQTISRHDEWIRIELRGKRGEYAKLPFLLIAFRNDKHAILTVLKRMAAS